MRLADRAQGDDDAELALSQATLVWMGHSARAAQRGSLDRVLGRERGTQHDAGIPVHGRGIAPVHQCGVGAEQLGQVAVP